VADPPRIGDLLDAYGATHEILGTADGYTVRRRNARGRPHGPALHARDLAELAEILAGDGGG